MEISQNMLLAGVIGGGLLVVITLICVVFTHFQKEREFTHAERMKSLELGQPWPDDPETARVKAKAARVLAVAEADDGPKSLANQCYAMTGYICGGGFFFAFVSGGSIAYALAASAGAIGVTGMICGTILASKEVSSQPSSRITKPKFDPEAV